MYIVYFRNFLQSKYFSRHWQAIYHLLSWGKALSGETQNLGTHSPSKTDEFSEKFQKFMLQIFAIIDDTSVMNFRKKLQYNFPKNEGGGQ